MAPKQIDCFNINMRFWKLLGLYPAEKPWRFYNYYAPIFIFTVIILYDILMTVNFYFLPRQLDTFIGELIFYFEELSVLSKVLSFYFHKDKIMKIYESLESDVFQPNTAEGVKIIANAKKFNVIYWKILAVVSTIAHLTHVSTPLVLHIFTPIRLELPVCSYSFLPENILQMFAYPLYLYQIIGLHFQIWYNLNNDTFFSGILVLGIAQFDILDLNLKNVTYGIDNDIEGDRRLIKNLNGVIYHYSEVTKFCQLVQDLFSVTLFIQFGMASCVICVCIFRLTLPATLDYYFFLALYTVLVLVQVFVPCWFGTQIMDKSGTLASSIYNSDWTSRSKRFKSSLRILVERFNQPITIIAGKMIPVSLETFTSIVNTAYSFFTLLRHMQTREA